jgi:hypothetical protein
LACLHLNFYLHIQLPIAQPFCLNLEFDHQYEVNGTEGSLQSVVGFKVVTFRYYFTRKNHVSSHFDPEVWHHIISGCSLVGSLEVAFLLMNHQI